MVYCGKLSKGCEECRRRRVRVSSTSFIGFNISIQSGYTNADGGFVVSQCDENPTGCSQCDKIHTPCPGYRNLVDFVFRDQSDSVRQKAKTKEFSKAQASASGTNRPNDQDDLDLAKTSRLVGNGTNTDIDSIHASTDRDDRNASSQLEKSSPSPYLEPDIYQRAQSFFLQNFVLGSPCSLWGFFIDLPSMCSSYAVDPCLLASMNSVGLAAMSNTRPSPQLLKVARDTYVSALGLANSAIQSPIDARKDTTLMAIMILAIFETVTGSHEHSLMAWEKHVHGAAEIVKYRGMAQFRSPAGVRMFAQVVSSLLLSCIQREVVIASDILALWSEAAKQVTSPDPGWMVQRTIIRLANLRSRVKRGLSQDLASDLEEAQRIDETFRSILANFQSLLGYQVININRSSSIVWDGYCHLYSDDIGVQLCNYIRSSKILCNEVIRNLLLQGTSSYPPTFIGDSFASMFQSATDELFKLQSEILATVPQQLGYLDYRRENPSDPNDPCQVHDGWTRSTGHFEAGLNSRSNWMDSSTNTVISGRTSLSEPMNIQYPRAYHLLWPLYQAGVTDVATSKAQEWVSHCLQNLSRLSGIKQALVLAGITGRRDLIDIWRQQETLDDMDIGASRKTLDDMKMV